MYGNHLVRIMTELQQMNQMVIHFMVTTVMTEQLRGMILMAI